MENLREERRTMVFYESPYRLVKTLEQFIEVFGPQRLCSVAREISKIHEEHVRGTLQEVHSHFVATDPKGEIVIVVAGLPRSPCEHATNSRTVAMSGKKTSNKPSAVFEVGAISLAFMILLSGSPVHA